MHLLSRQQSCPRAACSRGDTSLQLEAGLVIAEQGLPSTKGFSAPQAALPAGEGCTRCWEGTQWGHLTPTDHRDLLHHTTRGSAIKLGEGRLAEAALAWVGLG